MEAAFGPSLCRAVIRRTKVQFYRPDAGHDALLGLFERRFSQQIETTDAAAVLSVRPRG